jgi:tetratricopeptide (TPR) repeat protein
LVIARNSSFQFRGKAADIAEVGRKLGAQLLVEGSVRKIGNRIRVTVQLVEAANAAHLWAERYDRDLTDVFEIQDDITRTVVARVAGRARSVGAVRARSRPTESLTAYDWFLQARDYFGSDMTAHLAQPMLRKAIALDPNFADAHAMMSVLYTVRYLHDDDRRHLDEAMRAGRKALEINAEEPRANHALGFALTHLHRMDEAGHYLRLAIALNPNETFFRGDYANWLNYLGDVEAGLREIDEALLRDPYANDWFWDVRGSIEVMGGRFADALKSYQHMKTLAPWSRCHQVLCYSELGKFAEARACLEYIDRNWVVKPEDYVVDRFFLNLAQAERMLEALRRVRASM